MTPNFTVVELFCGTGGMTLGLLRAGFDVVAAYDKWPTAVENHRVNLGEHVHELDLSDKDAVIRTLRVINPTVVAGGPPCQDFSSAGSGIEGENANLTVSFAEIVAAVRPELVIMENVPGLETSDAWEVARAILREVGYGISICKIDCSFYNVAQRRHRLVIVCRLGERDEFISDAIRDAASSEAMTIRDLFGPQTPEAVWFPPLMPDRRAVWTADEPAPTIRSASTRPKPIRHAIAEDVRLLENGHAYIRPLFGGRGVVSVDEPMRTITRTSQEGLTQRYLNKPHPGDPICASQSVVLSMRQIAMLQGFPEDWVWGAASKRDKSQMIANAFPPPVAQAIGEVVMARYLGKTAPVAAGKFTRWLQRKGHSPAMSRKLRSHANRGRWLLNGRLYADLAQEDAALSSSPEFSMLHAATRSTIRRSLVLFAEFWELQNGKLARERAKRRERRIAALAARRTADGQHLYTDVSKDDG